MKWNFWLGSMAMFSVYFALAIPLWYSLKASQNIHNTAPPGAAFLLAIPFAIVSGVSVFLVCWLLQTQIKI